MTRFERLWRLRDAFRACFTRGEWRRNGKATEDASLTLNSLREFCYADKSTFHLDARAHALAEGRREVWLEIQRTLTLDDETLLRLKETDDE